jgi:hypothetical protein
MATSSLAEAFTQAMRSAPARWPRTAWREHEIDSATKEFVNGDFRIVLGRTGAGWEVRELSEAHATQRRLWWIWLVPGLAVVVIGVVAVATGANNWWLGGAGVATGVVGRAFFSEAHRRRRGGSREAVEPLYDD